MVGWLKQTDPEASTMHISHETLYKMIFIQLHSALKKELLRQLRAQRVMRQSRHFNTKGNARGGIIDTVSIHDRPQEVNNQVIPGHWEGRFNLQYICGTLDKSWESYIRLKASCVSLFSIHH